MSDDRVAEDHPEVPTAIRMQIRFCDHMIGDCKATLERLETPLQQKRAGNGERSSSRDSEA